MLLLCLVAAIAIKDDEKEAEQGQDEAAVDSRMTHDGATVDNHTLQRRHQCSTHDSHHEEGCTKVGVLGGDVLQRDTVDGGEHQAHEEADAHEAVEAGHADDEDGAK